MQFIGILSRWRHGMGNKRIFALLIPWSDPSATDGFPSQWTSNMELWLFLYWKPENVAEQTIEFLVIWDAMAFTWSLQEWNAQVSLYWYTYGMSSKIWTWFWFDLPCFAPPTASYMRLGLHCFFFVNWTHENKFQWKWEFYHFYSRKCIVVCQNGGHFVQEEMS